MSGRPWNPLLQIEPKYLHHIYVMRRRFAEPHLDELAGKWPNLPEFVLKGLVAAHGPWIHVNRFGYKWRVQKSAAHKKFSMIGLNAARWRIIPTLQRAAAVHGMTLEPESGHSHEAL